VKKSGFTLIELMVAMVIGLTAITSMYSLGSAMSRQFYEEQRVASTQGTSRVAILELRRDISRAGLFGSPNGTLEPTCDTIPPSLPKLGGGNGPMGAFQYYADYDQTAVFDLTLNPDAHADRLRILTSLYLTDQLLVHSAGSDDAGNKGAAIVLQTGNQAFRRTFSWGQTAGPFTAGAAPDYLTGDLDWDSAWAGQTATWNGMAQKGARAFQTGSVLHIETDHGRHFFRAVFGKDNNTQDEVRIRITPPLPLGTACLPGAAEGATVAPLQWVEYAVVDPFDIAQVGAEFMDFDGMFSPSLVTSSPIYNMPAAASTFETSNRVLIRRVLDATTGNVRLSSTQVVAEFVTNFQVSFIIDTDSGNPGDPTPTLIASSNENTINDFPEQVRSVIIDLGIRSPLEDPTLDTAWTPNTGTRFNVSAAQTGAARVRNVRIEIPVMNVARRNL
jgi:prepilin-type N-terminal cleavage/methylation domain-containing protein